jgi:hypothetical protein
MEAASPRESPVMLVIRETGSRLMIRKMFIRVIFLSFGFYDQFCGTLRTGIDLTTGTDKAIAAVPVGEIALNGSPTIMTKNYFYQFIHTEDE